MNPYRLAWMGALTVSLWPFLAGCDGLVVSLPGGIAISANTLTVTVTNTTDFPVDPRLYADDDEDTFFDFNIVTDENHVATGLIAPHSSRTFVLSCDRAGTIKSDHALFDIPGAQDEESDNDPKVTAEDDFDCGSVIEFIFYDRGDAFRTRVVIDGREIED